jgi:hypothetical protein
MCYNLSFNFYEQGTLLTEYTFYQLLRAHRVQSGCLTAPDMYTLVIFAEEYWILNFFHFTTLPSS